MKTYIGIDLGGTNVRVAKVTEFGEVLSQSKGTIIRYGRANKGHV